MLPPPLAISPALPSELLTYVLAHQIHPTTLIICQPRAAFLTSLISSIPPPIQRQPPPAPAVDASIPKSHADIEAQEPVPPELQRHPLLIPTLHQIATSRHINVVFIPTVSHLRAYLSVFPPPQEKDVNEKATGRTFDGTGRKTPLLILYGLVDLHRDTSEWSAQGLGNSIAGLVESGWRAERRVIVIEARKGQDSVREGGIEDEEPKTNPGWKVWEERVPMLNGSVRRAGFESEDSAWSGRTIEVGRILARWFRFSRGDWDIDEQD